MEKLNRRITEHLCAWSVAFFAGLLLLSNKGSEVFTLGPVQWYTPFVWVLMTALLLAGCVLTASIPAFATAYIAEHYRTWTKPRKAVFVTGAFVVAMLCIVFVVKLPI